MDPAIRPGEPIETDLLVVGLGPAGASAALEAARAGVAVVGIDKRAVPGEPAQCAELIPLPLSATAYGAGAVIQRIETMRTFLPSGREEVAAMPGLMIDRARFDRAIAEQARHCGARILGGARLTGLDAARREARIALGGVSTLVRFRLLVAADGPHSVVARELGLAPLATVATRQYRVPLRRPLAESWIWVGDRYAGGYAWLFPRAAEANLGLGADKARVPDLKAPLARLHAELAAAGVVGTEVLARTGGSIPVGGLRERMVHGAVLFAGDAAGLTHPISGGGIPAAVISGELAGRQSARALEGEPTALAEYEEELRDRFEPTVARALLRRAELEHSGWPGDDAPQRRGWIAFSDYYA